VPTIRQPKDSRLSVLMLEPRNPRNFAVSWYLQALNDALFILHPEHPLSDMFVRKPGRVHRGGSRTVHRNQCGGKRFVGRPGCDGSLYDNDFLPLHIYPVRNKLVYTVWAGRNGGHEQQVWLVQGGPFHLDHCRIAHVPVSSPAVPYFGFKISPHV